ncbi:MAG: hypothetical protein KDK25_00945 [Leptospiraceae bacterium]|nr:hypothetical protein [Leptospiraceae bacterium]
MRRAGPVAILILLLLPGGLWAIPGYSQATEILKQEWSKRYPASLKSIRANPEGLGIYRTRESAGLTYYYHFRVSVPRLVRAEDGSLKEEDLRTVEVWMRYRPASDSYDLAFVRRDLLPSGGSWIR